MCDNPARYRFTWPGRNESTICEEHAGKLRAVANGIGFHLQIVPLSEEDLRVGIACNQKDN